MKIFKSLFLGLQSPLTKVKLKICEFVSVSLFYFNLNFYKGVTNHLNIKNVL